MNGMQSQMTMHGMKQAEIEQIIAEVRERKSGEHTGKLIMDHKCWDDTRKLTNERTGFRDWKVRFKDPLRQTTKCKAWKKIMEFIEMPTMSIG